MSYRDTTGGFGWDVGNHTNYEDNGEYSGSSVDKGDEWKIYDEHDDFAGFSRMQNDDLIYHYDWNGTYIGKSVHKSGDRWDDYDAACNYIGTHRDGYPGRPVKEMYEDSYYDSGYSSGSSYSSYSSSSSSSSDSGGWSGFSVGGMLVDSLGDIGGVVLAALVALIFALIVYAVFGVLTGLGILKSKTTFTLTRSGYNEDIENNAVLVIDSSRSKKSYEISFDEDGTALFNLHSGYYILSLESDGASVYSTQKVISGIDSYLFELDTSSLYNYVFCFSFIDPYGDSINPQSVCVSINSEEAESAVKTATGEWFYLTQGDYSDGGTITIFPDSYEEVSIDFDELYRTNNIEIILTEGGT